MRELSRRPRMVHMPLLIGLALIALPFVEVWLMILIGQQIGAAWTIALLFALSASGIGVVRGAGTRVFREADEAMRTGVRPQGGLLDTLMVMVGGILLLIPGFVTAAAGGLLALPFTRPALRWVFTGWAERRITKMRTAAEARTGQMGTRASGPDTGRTDRGTSRVIQGRVVGEKSDRPES